MAFGRFFFGSSVLTLGSSWWSGHPGGVRLQRPLGGDLLQVAPELDGAGAGHVAMPQLRITRPPERERIAGHRDADVDADHAALRAAADVTGHGAAGGEHAGGIAGRDAPSD